MAGAVEVIVSKRKLAALQRTLRDVPGGLNKALVGAVNDTAMATKRQMASAIYDRIMIKKKDISPHIRVKRAHKSRPSATVSLSETHRLSLKRFGARQIKSGVSYKIERKGARQRIPGRVTRTTARRHRVSHVVRHLHGAAVQPGFAGF